VTAARYPRPPQLPPPETRLLVVEASAGTGKTYFLEHRVVDLLLQTRANIGEILVVTFTEKATAELRARIRALIGTLEGLPDGAGADLDPSTSWTIDAAARKKLREALTGFDRAPIHTIHGFCHRLLIDDAFAGHRLFDQRQIPDEAAFAEAFHLALRERFAVDPGDAAVLDAYLGVGNTVAKLRDALLMCARRAAPITPILDEPRLAAAATRLVAAVAGAPALEIALGATSNKSTKNAIATRVATIATALAEAGPHPAQVAAALSGEPIGDVAWILERRDKLVGVNAAGQELLAALAELCAAHTPILAICAHRFLPEVVARVQASKARRGHFDFQDMLRLVGEALAGDRGAELAARLRAMHPWALIDEFQDTDDVQWDIFRTVWAEGETTSLAIVGDPKQAIYSFRGADVHTYLRARAALTERGATRVELTDNYRSSTALVAAVNALVGGRDYAPFFTGDIRYDAPVRAASTTAGTWPDGSVPSPVHVFEIDAPSGNGKNDAVAATLAERIGDEIHALLSPPPEARLQLTLRDGVRALRPADIHVLTRSGRQSDDVAIALRARGVPCALFQREHLFDAPEAREVADLLDAIADPRDRSRRLRAWTTSFFAVPLAELGAVTEVPDDHPLIALLHDWRVLALRKDYDALLHRVLDDTRWVERTLVAGGGERAVTNVLHLFELLHDEVARSRCEIHELAARLRGWIRMGQLDRPDDLDLQRLETDRQAVQVMTIHRAKGLEAAIVFVHGGHTAVPLGKDQASLYHDGGERRIHVGAASGATAAAIQQDVVEENQRLLYVAMTRARVRLYLPVVHHNNLADTAALAAVQRGLIGALAARATDPDSARLFTSERIAANSLEAPPPVEAAEDLRGWAPPPTPEPEAEDPLWADVRTRRRGAVVTSYSRLKQAAARASDRDDARAEEHSVAIALDDRELPAGAATGLFLHDVLEHVEFATALETADPIAWSLRADVAPKFEAAARRHGLDRRHRDPAAQLLHRTLTREVQLAREVLPPLARAPRVAKEVEFVYPLRDDAFARGYVDLLVAWDERVWVVDYKSDVLASTTLAAATVHVHEHYHQQAQLYGVAAARLLGLDGEAACARRFGGVLYWFLRYDYVVDLPVTWGGLGRWTTELAAALEGA